MQYPYGTSGREQQVRSRTARKMHHSPAHELAALPKMTPVGKPKIVPLTS
jgi:hypothetical protein